LSNPSGFVGQVFYFDEFTTSTTWRWRSKITIEAQSPDITLTADNPTPLPSILDPNYYHVNQPSKIRVTAAVVNIPDGKQLDFSAQFVDVRSAGGHVHDDNTKTLRIGKFDSFNKGDKLETDPRTSCIVQSQMCAVDFYVSEVSGSYTISAALHNNSAIFSQVPITVEVPTVASLQKGSTYEETGSWDGGHNGVTSQHTLNHNGTYTLLTAIPAVANAYFANQSTSGDQLGINDMSLPIGGLFDIKNNWVPSHGMHRSGNSVDIDHCIANHPKTKVDCVVLKKIMNDSGLDEIPEPCSIHFQVRGTKTLEESESDLLGFSSSNSLLDYREHTEKR
jgi:hypothetical protein